MTINWNQNQNCNHKRGSLTHVVLLDKFWFNNTVSLHFYHVIFSTVDLIFFLRSPVCFSILLKRMYEGAIVKLVNHCLLRVELINKLDLLLVLLDSLIGSLFREFWSLIQGLSKVKLIWFMIPFMKEVRIRVFLRFEVTAVRN